MKNATPLSSDATTTPKIRQKEVSTSIKAILRSQKGETKGVYIRLIINREYEYFSTGYFVLPEDFHRKEGYVKKSDPNKEAINSAIIDLKKEMNDVLYNLNPHCS